MSNYSVIDLSRLPAPTAIEPLNFDAILSAMRADLVLRAPELQGVLALESDPINKVLEVCAYRELILRQRENDAVKSVLLAFAIGSDLDHLAALFGVSRHVVDAGDATATPPIPPIFEPDDRLRERIQLSIEGFSTAGPRGAYIFHALSASPEVKDATVVSPAPGEVIVTVLATDGDGTAKAALLQTVRTALNDDDVRPLTDHVTVESAQIIAYAIEATLITYPDPDASVVRAAAIAATTAQSTEHHRLGHDITLSSLYAALHQPGVQRVILSSPLQDIICNNSQAAYCTGLTIIDGGSDV